MAALNAAATWAGTSNTAGNGGVCHSLPLWGRWREAPDEVPCRIVKRVDWNRMRSEVNEDLIRLAALGTFPIGEGFAENMASDARHYP